MNWFLSTCKTDKGIDSLGPAKRQRNIRTRRNLLLLSCEHLGTRERIFSRGGQVRRIPVRTGSRQDSWRTGTDGVFPRIFVQVFFFNLGTTGGASIEETKTGGFQLAEGCSTCINEKVAILLMNSSGTDLEGAWRFQRVAHNTDKINLSWLQLYRWTNNCSRYKQEIKRIYYSLFKSRRTLFFQRGTAL